MGERVNGGVGLKNTAVESRQGQRLEPPVAARAIWGEHDRASDRFLRGERAFFSEGKCE